MSKFENGGGPVLSKTGVNKGLLVFMTHTVLPYTGTVQTGTRQADIGASSRALPLTSRIGEFDTIGVEPRYYAINLSQ